MFVSSVGDTEGFPVYRAIDGTAGLYFSQSQWLFLAVYSLETVTKRRANSQSPTVKDGRVPLGEQKWKCCNVDSKWEDRSVTLTALTAAEMEAAKEEAKEAAAVAEAEAAAEEAEAEAYEREREQNAKDLFAILDVDADGKLNKDEFKAFLQGVAEWGKEQYTDERWDTVWLEECKRFKNVPDGITWERFWEYRYSDDDYDADDDLRDCKQWASMSKLDQKQHMERGCLSEMLAPYAMACDVCGTQILEKTRRYNCARCAYDMCESCAQVKLSVAHLRLAEDAAAKARAARTPSIKEIFELFDVDGDGKLNKKEYKVYLQGIHQGYCVRGSWDDEWVAVCKLADCLIDGITWEGFEGLLYGCYYLERLDSDLEACRSWTLMSVSERQSHVDTTCLKPVVSAEAYSDRCSECYSRFDKGDTILECKWCNHQRCEGCAKKLGPSQVLQLEPESGPELALEPEPEPEPDAPEAVVDDAAATSRVEDEDKRRAAAMEAAAASGLDQDSIATAEDEDWEAFGIAIEDGRLIRAEMRQALGYAVVESEPGAEQQLGGGEDDKGDETKQFRSVLQSVELSHLYDTLAAFSLDNHSIAQADDEDWEMFEVAISDGRRLRTAMRAAIGYT